MPILNPADLAFNGEEVRDLQEATYEMVFQKPEFTLFHTFVEGIKAKQQIVILGLLNGLTGKGDGGCDPVANPNSITNTQKFWDPVTISDRITECWKDLQEIFFIYGTQNGIKKQNLTKTDFFNFLMERRADSLIEEVFRHVWFGDTAADNVPGGVITAGVDLDFFNKIDGYWEQIFVIVGADADRQTLGLDSRNGQATYADQLFTAADTTNRVVTNTLQNMRFGADTRLRKGGAGELMYVATQSVSDQYERELIAAQAPFSIEYLENGIQIIKSGGIDVVSFEFWDRMIRDNYDNGASYFLPHRAVLLTKANMQIGTEASGTLSEMDVIYDPTTKKNHLDTSYDLDAKIIEDYKIQVAY